MFLSFHSNRALHSALFRQICQKGQNENFSKRTRNFATKKVRTHFGSTGRRVTKRFPRTRQLSASTPFDANEEKRTNVETKDLRGQQFQQLTFGVCFHLKSISISISKYSSQTTCSTALTSSEGEKPKDVRVRHVYRVFDKTL